MTYFSQAELCAYHSFWSTKLRNDARAERARYRHCRRGVSTLVGPSGCGKSTLLRIIAGLEQQGAGDVAIGSTVVNHIRPSRRDLAMVFQSYALYPHLTVQQNMEIPLRLRDLSGWERMPLIGAAMPGRGVKLKTLRGLVRETAETLKIEHLLHASRDNCPVGSASVLRLVGLWCASRSPF